MYSQQYAIEQSIYFSVLPHPCPYLPSGLFLYSSLTKILKTFHPSPTHATYDTYHIIPDLITITIFMKSRVHKYQAPGCLYNSIFYDCT